MSVDAANSPSLSFDSEIQLAGPRTAAGPSSLSYDDGEETVSATRTLMSGRTQNCHTPSHTSTPKTKNNLVREKCSNRARRRKCWQAARRRARCSPRASPPVLRLFRLRPPRRLSRSQRWQPRGCSTAAAAATSERRLSTAKLSRWLWLAAARLRRATVEREGGSDGCRERQIRMCAILACATVPDVVSPRHILYRRYRYM